MKNKLISIFKFFIVLIMFCCIYGTLDVNATGNPSVCSAEWVYNKINPEVSVDGATVTITLNGSENGDLMLGDSKFYLAQVYAYRTSDNPKNNYTDTDVVGCSLSEDLKVIKEDSLDPNNCSRLVSTGEYKVDAKDKYKLNLVPSKKFKVKDEKGNETDYQNEIRAVGNYYTNTSLENKKGSSVKITVSENGLVDKLSKYKFRFIFKRGPETTTKKCDTPDGKACNSLDCYKNGSCKNVCANNVYFYVDVDELGKEPITTKVSRVEGDEKKNPIYLNDSAIDCTRYLDYDINGNPIYVGDIGDNANLIDAIDSFEKRFCFIKYHKMMLNSDWDLNSYDLSKNPGLLNRNIAERDENDKLIVDSSKIPAGGIEDEYVLKCNPDTMVEMSDAEIDSMGYYKNANLFYAFEEKTENAGAYTYNFYPGGTPKTEDVSCTRKCEETVEVRYGPPVASKAGACFQYKVKVISRVACSVSGNINPPKSPEEFKIYTPVPYCTDGWGSYNQGGPDDNFDDCINECDGGKYSLSCSKKCSNKVYGDSQKLSSTDSMISYKVTKLENESADESATCKDGKVYDEETKKCEYVVDKVPEDVNSLEKCKNSTVNSVCKGLQHEDLCRNYYKSLGYENNDNVNNYGCYYKNSANIVTWEGKDINSITPPESVGGFNRWGKGLIRNDYVCSMNNFGYNCYYVNNHIPGRWYVLQGHGGWGLGGYIYQTWGGQGNNGIYRANYGGSPCADSCWWSGSPGAEDYMNYDNIFSDYARNLSVYEKAKNTCNAAATCSTTTSEYTISADTFEVTRTGVSKVEHNFPKDRGGYDTDVRRYARANGGNAGKYGTEPNSGTTLIFEAFDDFDSTSNNGCYDNNDTVLENRYRTTWTFPGSFYSEKYGKYLYDKSTTDYTNSPYNHDKQFCISYYSTNVNSEWLKYYRNLYYVNHLDTMEIFGMDDSCVNTYDFTDSSYSYEVYRNEKESKVYPNISWNIKASTRKFGYFGWNFDIYCFYAASRTIDYDSSTPAIDGSPDAISTGKMCIDNPEKYRIRAVDERNMFPDPDGSPLPSTDSVGVGKDTNVNTSGTDAELLPFNWSSRADTSKHTEYNNKDYAFNPRDYITHLQTNYASSGFNPYSEDVLDYEFDLSPSDLRSLRNTSHEDRQVYKSNIGDVKEINDDNIPHYKSTVIHETLNKGKIPKDSAIKCLNMENYKSSKCLKCEGGSCTYE